MCSLTSRTNCSRGCLTFNLCSLRLAHKLKVRQPLAEIFIITKNINSLRQLQKNTEIIQEELNIKKITFHSNESDFVRLSAKANFKILGKKYGGIVQDIAGTVAAFSPEQINKLSSENNLAIEVQTQKITLAIEDIIISRTEKEGTVSMNEGEITVVLNTQLDTNLIEEGYARDFINLIQKTRKDLNLFYTDKITIAYKTQDNIRSGLTNFEDYIRKETLAEKLSFTDKPDHSFSSTQIDGSSLKILIIKI